MFTPQQLRVLVTIRDTGSLSAAATALGYGVPTIAHHLAALEGAAGARLVDRVRTGSRLTPLGEALATEADDILSRHAQAERLIAAHRDSGMITLRVAAFASVGSRLLPAAIRALRERSNVQVEVVEAEPTETIRMLRAREVHAGLIYDTADDPSLTAAPDLAQTVLLDEPWAVLTGRSADRDDGAPLEFADLGASDWICSRDRDEASDRVLRRACHAAGFEPRVLMRIDDLNMIHGLVAAGLGLALTTAAAVDRRFDVALHPPVPDLGLRRTSFVTLAGRRLAAADELLRILRAQADHSGAR